MFQPVNSQVNIPELETELLKFWRAQRIFERSMEERQDAPRYVTYEGPPTVNGQPGVHHVLARAFKDIFPRYKTMRGFYALRKGGWDTHGLPVELAMEKELGLKHKYEIEAYGIAAFNERCRASVLSNIATWKRFTERMAYWTDLEGAYATLTNDYIESVWWVLKQLFDKSLLYKGLKIVPYCARCGTPLSSHEVSLGYKEVDDPSVYVRFQIVDEPGVSFLVWTTTPWTLPANVALAIGADVDYVQVEGIGADGETTEQLILAEALVNKALVHPEAYQVVKRFKGRDLVGKHYTPLYRYLPVEGDYAYVVTGDFVSTEDGTGIVHIAPAFGADDMAIGQEYGLPILKTVDDQGQFIEEVTDFKGMWVKDADNDIKRDLKSRGLLYKSEAYHHTYPFCWRCNTPLLYYARDTWFIRTTEYRQTMIDLNQTINWVPAHVRDGRFGNWLTELKDWALGRERYWGTTLPIWMDEDSGDTICVGSVAELSALVGRDLSALDLHRPYIDEITFPNPNRPGGVMRRVPEVIDVWFDSGSMPVAQWGYPANDQTHFADQFPADYICEAVDQTRGWFYTLHSISSMVFEQVAFKNVICLGLILDGKGEKMSKSKGNVIDPWDIMNEHGADAFRWYLFTSGAPGESRRFSSDLVGEVVSKMWLTLWNTYSFFVTYANSDGWTPDQKAPPVAERPELDRFVLAELNQLVQGVTNAFDTYDVPNATRPVQAFVEMLSNWYVRLSRRRFWRDERDADKMAAYATLYECLVTLSKLIAPTMPYLADALYRNLVVTSDPHAPESVHLAEWATADAALIDSKLIDDMRLVQRLVSLGRAARETVKIGVRQPLLRADFVTRSKSEGETVLRLADLIAGELNVREIGLLSESGDLVSYSINPLPSFLGKKFGKALPQIRTLLRDGDTAFVRPYAETLLRGQAITVELDGVAYEMEPHEVEVRRQAREGFAVAEDMGYLAVLTTTLTEELMLEGLAREVVRRVQSLRRDADLNISDTIAIRYQASERLQAAITRFSDYIAGETLATMIEDATPHAEDVQSTYAPDASGDRKKDTSIDGEVLTLGIRRL